MNIQETPNQKVILDIVDRIKKNYRPQKIILFGSYAYGQPHRDSDIDLMVVKETSERPIDRRVNVSRIVSDPKRLVPFGVIVLTPQELSDRLNRGDQFIAEIIKNGRILYEG